ncbi:MAG: polyphenol oxidase family protein [Actinomyces sp.]|jgi:YfiH family protein|nr:polyphenol oxidase family protein [Actinomyces sp.]MCI1641275.1 polyphenol oxidase family protein [Actinomyces sp.]MCI1662094.1 polyphenol oxidase family protein [Actinomyces sp.]MCI1690923.1 polyphenol oxidase family protein [Actinomyces sp.]MCI1786896.1 polyphenol oxidase family protein [Actinomyces sp.]MCI1828962.1 polyphenol oxidase family protein [Actinomyces sp.]
MDTRLLLGAAPALLTTAGPGGGSLRANLALNVGDDPALVHGRRAGLSRRLGRAVVWMAQTHSTRVDVVSGSDAGRWEGPEWGPLECDGVVVDARDWPGAPAVAVVVADCLPVLLATADGMTVAAVHAGRRGLAGGILTEAVARLRSLRGEDAEVHAAIGPAICGRCYEVPDSLRAEVARTHPAAWATTSWGTASLDLPAAAREELAGLGVAVRAVGACTRETPVLHSYRRDPACGRQAGVIAPAP